MAEVICTSYGKHYRRRRRRRRHQPTDLINFCLFYRLTKTRLSLSSNDVGSDVCLFASVWVCCAVSKCERIFRVSVWLSDKN